MSDENVPFTKMINVPPVWLLGTVLCSLLWDKMLPLVDFGGTWSMALGALLIVASMALFIWSVMEFQTADTPVHPRRKPTTLLTTGIYARSRNPIYLSMVGAATGAALCFGSLGAFIPVAAFVWILTDLFIKGEEFHIGKNFGDEWQSYTAKTRRWI